MDTTIDASGPARSRTAAKPDPAAVWAPLTDLTEAAARAATESGAIAITRGFDRLSRQRGKALRELLAAREIAAIEVTPAVGSERLLADTDIAAVVNLVGAGACQPYRLAAKLRAPLLAPRTGDEAASDETKRDVIGVQADEVRDVALSHVALRPETSEDATITVTCDGEPVIIAGGEVTIGLRDRLLDIGLQGPNTAEQTFTAQEVTVATEGAPYLVVRDELPLTEFEGTVTFAAEPQGLVVRPV